MEDYRKSCTAYWVAWFRMTLSETELKVTFAVLNLCNNHNSGNIACFNCSVFTHKLESALCLWFKLHCQRWWTAEGPRQSHALEKWLNLGVGNGARDVVTTGNEQEVSYLIAVIVMNLSVFEGYSLISSSNAIFRICGMTSGPSASAELLVAFCHLPYMYCCVLCTFHYVWICGGITARFLKFKILVVCHVGHYQK